MQKKLNEDFIEKYCEQFAAKISEDFYVSNSHIGGQEILRVTPSKQVNFFVIKLLFNNWQQEAQRLESPFFNYGEIKVKEALGQFMNVLSRFIQIERKEFEGLLRDAIRDTLFLILTPSAYLEIEFDRRGAEDLNEKLAKSILKYIKIAKPDFESYFQSNIGTDKDELMIGESLISDVILEEEIAKLNEVVPLTLKRLEEGDGLEDLPEPPEVLQEDVETAEGEMDENGSEEDAEKDMLKSQLGQYASPTIARSSEPKEKLVGEPDNAEDDDTAASNETEEEVEVPSNTPTEETEPEVNEQVNSPIEAEVEAEDPEIEKSDEVELKESDSSEIQAEEDAKESPEETEITDDEVEEETKNEIEETTSEPPVPDSEEAESIVTNMASGEEEDEDEDTLNDKFEDPLAVPTIAESHEGQTESMMAAISVNHRYMFINELFDGEPDLFTEAINKVEVCNSFDESVEVLVQNYAKEFHWDMNSDEVKELLKIIFRRFR